MHMGANTSRCWRGWRQGREKGHVERRAAPHGWEWLARGRVKRPGCVIRSWTGGRRVPAVRGPSPTLDTPEVPITLKPRKCTSLRCAPARGAAEAERRQGPASGLSWELGAAGHTSVTLSRPQTRAAREALEMPRNQGGPRPPLTFTLVGLLPPLQCDSRPGPCVHRRSPSDSPRSPLFSEPPVHF